MAERCPACLHDTAQFSFEKMGYRFSRCSDCDFLFASPYPSEREIAAFYNANYLGASEDHYPKIASRKRRAWVKSIRFIPYLIGRDAIDLGCGPGAMAHAFSRWGARASGLDINESGIAYARKHFPGCTFYCETFAQFRKRGLTFDFVFSTDVLEHLAGPAEFMATLAAITRPGGHVYIAAPDSGHAAVPRDISQWSDVSPPAHLQFFNRRNIEILFARYGFVLKRADRKRTPAHSLIFVRSAA